MAAQTTTKTQTASAAWSAAPRGFLVDRVVVAILLVCIALAAAGVFLTAIGLLRPMQLVPDAGKALEDTILLRTLPYGIGRVIAGATAAVVGLVAVLLLLRRIVPGTPRPSTQHHILSADEQGLVIVDKRGISAVAGAAVQRIPGVVDVNVRVIGGGTSAVRLVVRTWVHAGAELQSVGDEAREGAREAVEKLVGLDVRDVVVRLHVVPLEDLDRVVE